MRMGRDGRVNTRKTLIVSLKENAEDEEADNNDDEELIAERLEKRLKKACTGPSTGLPLMTFVNTG